MSLECNDPATTRPTTTTLESWSMEIKDSQSGTSRDKLTLGRQVDFLGIYVLLMEENPAPVVRSGSLSHYLQGFGIHPTWRRISSINSMFIPLPINISDLDLLVRCFSLKNLPPNGFVQNDEKKIGRKFHKKSTNSDVTPPKTNMTGWNIHHEWRCLSYWKWEMFPCHVSFQGCNFQFPFMNVMNPNDPVNPCGLGLPQGLMVYLKVWCCAGCCCRWVITNHVQQQCL